MWHCEVPTLTWFLFLPSCPQSTDSIGSGSGVVMKTGSSWKASEWTFLCLLCPTLTFSTRYFWRKCFFSLSYSGLMNLSRCPERAMESSLGHRGILKSFSHGNTLILSSLLHAISDMLNFLIFFGFNFLTVRERSAGFILVDHEENLFFSF